MAKTYRINKYIALSGICSRRKADELVKGGKVMINGEVITDFCEVTVNDEVKVDGKIIVLNELVYYLFYKPAGCITSMSDELNRKTIYDYLPLSFKNEHIFPVGRLDYDTKGLLILTNDGDFSNMIAGPTSGVSKTYQARIEGIVTKEELMPFYKGIRIDGKKLLPAKFEIVSIDKKHDSSLVNLTITEGINHQVKLMFNSINHPVKKLKRIAIGDIKIDGLAEGEVRILSIAEIRSLKMQANLEKNMRLR